MNNNVIAILGAGFCGVVCAREIVRHARTPMTLQLFDGNMERGTGIAYATNCPLHLLNVPAGKMGAPPGKPGDFIDWLRREEKRWRPLDPVFADLVVSAEAFLPRRLYAAYLVDVKRSLMQEAADKGIQLHWIAADVVDIDRADEKQYVVTAGGGKYPVDAAVLALSSPWTRQIPHTSSRGYLPAPWPTLTDMPAAKALLQALPSSAAIGIIGAGLTMLDMLATLDYCGYRGNVTVIATRTTLPQPHEKVSTDVPIDIEDLPATALGLLRTVRHLAHQYPWRAVIDALRPKTSALWQRLPPTEQRRFLRHLLGFWNSHRHRVPPQILSLVDKFTAAGQLTFIAARVEHVEDVSGGVALSMRPRGSEERAVKVFDLVVNCSGPTYAINKHDAPLIHRLLQKGIVAPDPLGLGFQPENGTVYCLGSLLFGSRFETTAVPELREQCQEAAIKITNKREKVCT